ncbi:MAG TPA: hypothetical protein VGJ81_00900 [Thermoanaerobaculia bacterium]
MAMIVSWVIPLEMVGNHVTYFTSLVFWAVPIALLLCRLYHQTDPGSRRRRAFWLSTAFIFVAGVVLDFLLGSWILRFDDDPTHKTYLYRFPFGQRIPLEEVLFYFMGGMAILLVYFWADEYWMSAYNRRQRRTNAELPIESGWKLIRFSPHVLVWAILLLLAGFAMKWWRTGSAWPPPLYFSFLVFVSIVPAIAVARDVSKVVNWRAFSFTCLYVLITSCIWEVTLGLPGSWWWYREPPAMMNWYLRPFSLAAARPYPIEALLVWLVVSFDSIFAYEFLKGITYEPRGVKVALFGE